MKLLEFDYSIEYKKGKENQVADALSRKHHSVLAISSAIPAWILDIEANYNNDTVYIDIIHQLAVNNQAMPNYTLHAGVLRYKGKICIGGNSGIKSHILTTLHSSSMGGGGIQVSGALIKE
jgi:hypothetical protein